MRRYLRAFAAATTALAVVSGCATGSTGAAGTTAGNTTAVDKYAAGTPAQQQALARYLVYAGPPQPYFAWVGRLFSVEPLSKDQLVVTVAPGNDGVYLLKVWPPCDLRLAVGGSAVGISSMSRTVYVRSDSITLNTGSGGRVRCPIDEIRRIDYQRMQADLKAQGPSASTSQ